MSEMGVWILERECTWDSPGPPVKEERHWALSSAMEFVKQFSTSEPPWRQLAPVFNPERRIATGVSDASLWARAFAFHTGTVMRAVITPWPNRDIFRHELIAIVEGEEDLHRYLSPGDSYVWWGDNSGSLCCLKRGWSRRWDVNPMILRNANRRRERGCGCSHRWVESKMNLVDPLTRYVRGLVRDAPACALHPGALCPEFEAFLQGVAREARVGK